MRNILAVKILFCIIFISCSTDINVEENSEYKIPIKEIGREDSKALFYKPRFIKYNNIDKRVYVSDTGNNRIIVLDDNLNFIKEYGSFGQGPGEFNRPEGIAFSKENLIHIFEASNSRIQIFNSQFMLNSGFQLPSAGFRASLDIDSNDRILLNAVDNKHLFSLLDKSGNILGNFGIVYEYDQNHLSYLHNQTIFRYDEDGNLYCAFVNHPVLRKYDKFNNLVFEVNTDFIPGVKKQIKNWEKRITEKGGPNIYLSKSLVRDISIDKSFIYLGVAGEKGFPVYVFNKMTGKPIKKIYLTYGESYIPAYYDFSSENYIYAIEKLNMVVLKYEK